MVRIHIECNLPVPVVDGFNPKKKLGSSKWSFSSFSPICWGENETTLWNHHPVTNFRKQALCSLQNLQLVTLRVQFQELNLFDPLWNHVWQRQYWYFTLSPFATLDIQGQWVRVFLKPGRVFLVGDTCQVDISEALRIRIWKWWQHPVTTGISANFHEMEPFVLSESLTDALHIPRDQLKGKHHIAILNSIKSLSSVHPEAHIYHVSPKTVFLQDFGRNQISSTTGPPPEIVIYAISAWLGICQQGIERRTVRSRVDALPIPKHQVETRGPCPYPTRREEESTQQRHSGGDKER